MHLGSFTRPDLIFPDLDVGGGEELLRRIAAGVVAAGQPVDAEELFEQLLERESLGSTGIGGGVAIPHCKLKELEQVVLAVGVTRRGIDFDAADGQPVRLFFVVASPENEPTAHLKTLAAISKWVQVKGHVERLLGLADGERMFELLDQADRDDQGRP